MPRQKKQHLKRRKAHAVHAVIEIGTVAHRCHHKDGQDYEEHPSGCVAVFAHETEYLAVVEVVVLHKRYRGD